jgi:hypothetical protein
MPAMSREERVARNEATSRRINEKLEAAQADDDHRYLRLVCECGRGACEELVAVSVEEYERVRSDPVQFVVRRDHVMEDVERAIYETDRFVVVAKREGTPAAIAIEEDPRS